MGLFNFFFGMTNACLNFQQFHSQPTQPKNSSRRKKASYICDSITSGWMFASTLTFNPWSKATNIGCLLSRELFFGWVGWEWNCWKFKHAFVIPKKKLKSPIFYIRSSFRLSKKTTVWISWAAKDSPMQEKKSIFVASEQGLDASA